MVRIICLLIGYAFGLFQTSYIYGRTKGIDIREHGSGNAGLTNFYRTFGGPLTFGVIMCDVLKAVIAVLLGQWLFGGLIFGGPDGTADLRCIAPGNTETADGVCCGRNDSRPQLPVLLRLPRRKRNRCDRGSDYLI